MEVLKGNRGAEVEAGFRTCSLSFSSLPRRRVSREKEFARRNSTTAFFFFFFRPGSLLLVSLQ